MKAFISYANADKKAADTLARALNAAGITAWLDEEDVQIGSEWHKSIARALDSSNAMVVLVSPDSMNSRWVRKEIEHALVEPRFAHRLIPVIVRATAKETIPWIVAQMPTVKLGKSKAGVEKSAKEIADLLLRPTSKSKRRTGS